MSYTHQGRAAALSGLSPSLVVMLAARISNPSHRAQFLDGFYFERLKADLTSGGRPPLGDDAMVGRKEVWATR